MINGNARDLQDQLIDEFEIRPQTHYAPMRGIVNAAIYSSIFWIIVGIVLWTM